MRTRPDRPARSLALLASAILLLAACGGSAATQPPATPQPTATAAAAGSPTATEPSASAAAETPAPAGSAASGDEVSGAATALANLTSYKFRMKLEGSFGAAMPAPSSGGPGTFTMSGTVVLKPERALEITMSGLGGGETSGIGLRYIILGDKVYMDLGGTSMEVPQEQGTSVEDMFNSLSPQEMFGKTYGGYTNDLVKVGEEQRNGVATVHYKADAKTLAAYQDLVGGTGYSDWQMDLWIAREAGYMVSAITGGTVKLDGQESKYLVSMDITNVNDPANKVTKPS